MIIVWPYTHWCRLSSCLIGWDAAYDPKTLFLIVFIPFFWPKFLPMVCSFDFFQLISSWVNQVCMCGIYWVHCVGLCLGLFKLDWYCCHIYYNRHNQVRCILVNVQSDCVFQFEQLYWLLFINSLVIVHLLHWRSKL